MTLTVIAAYSIDDATHPFDLVISRGSVVDFAYPPNPSRAAVVNAANSGCLGGGDGGGGVDGALGDAGGPAPLADRRALPELPAAGSGVRCATGDAVTTGPGSYGRLGATYVVHAVGPDYSECDDGDGSADADELIASAYASSMERGREANIEAIAFPPLSAGVYRGRRSLGHVLRVGMGAIRRHGGYPALREVHVVCGHAPGEAEALVEIADGMGLRRRASSIAPTEGGGGGDREEGGGGDAPEEWEVRRDELKSEGDSHFRSGSYALAVRSYQDALELDPSNHVLLSNKSAAHLANGEKSKALHDARRCVEIAGSWAKGHTRLAAAMSSLGRHNEAAAVYSRVLSEMDPENEAARRGLEGCRLRQQNAREEKEREASELQRELDRQKAAVAGEKARREKDDAGPGNEEDDLLDDFFSEVEKVTEKPAPSTRKSDGADGKCDGDDDAKTNRIKEHINDLGTSAYQIDRLLQANYEWKNLNPFHVLDIPHTIDDDSVISLRYRAISLLVHPDKCPDDPARAKDAFEQVRKAMAQMNDADKRRHIRALVEQGMKQGKRDWDAEKSKGGANNGVVIGSGGDGEGLARAQNVATMKIFAEIEHTRRDIERRKRGFEQRERSQEDEEKAKEKNEREHDQRWREGDRVEKRIGNWRDFTGGGDRGGGKKGRLI